MFRFLNLLLLFCWFINNIKTANKPVRGIKGGNVTLLCEIQDGEISLSLSSQTENIDICETEECSGRVIKEGSCDVIIKDLIHSDAGEYSLNIQINNYQSEPELQIRKYQLHIQDEISVKAGDELKLDVLIGNANKVEKNMSGEWTEVWRSDNKVISDRMSISNASLIIKSVKATDAGTYRVLDSEGQVLITVTVTESKTNSNDTLGHKIDDKTNGTETPENNWILPFAVTLVVVAVIVALIVIAVKKWPNRPAGASTNLAMVTRSLLSRPTDEQRNNSPVHEPSE